MMCQVLAGPVVHASISSLAVPPDGHVTQWPHAALAILTALVRTAASFHLVAAAP